MSKQESKKRERERSPNNRTTTGFRIADELWAQLQPRLSVPVNTHRGWREDAHVYQIATVPKPFPPCRVRGIVQPVSARVHPDHQQMAEVLTAPASTARSQRWPGHYFGRGWR